MRRILILLVFLTGLLGPASLCAEDRGGVIVQSPATRGLVEVMGLGRHWFDEENKLHFVPFVLDDREETTLGRYFDIKDYASLPSQLFLYMEGVAWTGEVLLNDRLLGITTDPFTEQLMLVKKEWLQPSQNLLKLRLRTRGALLPYFPRPFLGVFRPVSLMAPAAGAYRPLLPTPAPAHPRKVVALAPWTPDAGYVTDTVTWGRWLDYLKGHGYPAVWFPFTPPGVYREMTARRGLQEAPRLEGDSIAFWNWYPVREQPADMRMVFWLNARGEPAPGFGRMYTAAQLRANRMEKPDRTFLILFIFLPILSLLLLKAITPRTYQSLPEYLTKSKIYLDLIRNAKFLKREQAVFLNLLRLVLLATHFSLYVYYLDLGGRFESLNLFSEESILFHLYHTGDYSPYVYFLHAFSYLLIFSALKYVFLASLGTVFRIHNFASTIVNLDIFAAYPLNLFPLVPSALLFFTVGAFAGVLEWVWLIFTVVFLARRIWAIYGGLSTFYQFSTGLKILYICTLEILPWLLFV